MKKLIYMALVLVIAISIFNGSALAASATTASPTASTVSVNGKVVSFDAYNIGGSNYFKLRDLAYSLNGTIKQFAVGYDNATKAITLTSGQPYTSGGGEMAKGDGRAKTANPTPSRIYLDGKDLNFTVYNIGGNNFFKLRDLMEVLNVNVGYDDTTKAITLDTSKGYLAEGSTQQTPGALFDWASPILASKLLEYYSLTAVERQIYDKLAAGIANFDLKIEVPQIDDRSDRLRILGILSLTHPEFFWWNEESRYSKDEHGKNCIWPIYIIDDKELYAVMRTDGKAAYPSEMEVADGKAWIENCKATICNIISEVPISKGMTQYEAELAAHDWLCDNTEYTSITQSDTVSCKTIYGAIVERKANCYGFTRTLQYILALIGVESVPITGRGSTSDHVWNAVKLDGQWYAVDASGNKVAQERLNFPVHYFFNRTDEFMLSRYVPFNSDFYSNPNITCTATRYDFYAITDSYIASDADFIEKLPACIAMARMHGDRVFELEFAKSYAEPSEVINKLKLIDPSLYAGIEFFYNSIGLVFGVIS